jgi:sporulation protein YlmC with PRC-barrel domain
MRPGEPIKLVAELLDLPIQDKDGRYCGIVDDVELSGTAGKEVRIKALMVGPGAYQGRLPGWAFRLVTTIAGGQLIRVTIDQVEQIHTAVHLKCRAEEVKLHAVENGVRGWIPKGGAM